MGSLRRVWISAPPFAVIGVQGLACRWRREECVIPEEKDDFLSPHVPIGGRRW